MSRTQFAVKNTMAGTISKISALILGFVSRTVFIYFLGNEYLGVSGLYTEVLSVLSFAELGFGSALTFAMYKPVADGDNEKVIKLLDFYKTVYRVIALIIALAGLAMMPFIQYVVTGTDSMTIIDLRLYFAIYLFNTVVSYFVSFKYSVVNAQQKNYIVTNIDMIIHAVTVVTQIIVMFVFKDFLIYLLTQSFLLLCSRVFISLYLNKKMPIFKEKCKVKLTKEERAPIIKNVKGLMVHQFAGIAVHSTDNIIISTFSGMGVIAVGLISNYNMLISSVTGFAVIIFSSVTSSFGNMVATSSKENYRKTFLDLNFLNFWIYGFCAVAFFVLIPPFITLWIGSENLIDQVSFALIITNMYFVGQCSVYHNARIAKGDFGMDKWWSLTQALVNLVVSVIGAIYLGLVGVYIGTIVSRLVFIITRPSSMYRYLFDRSPLEYYLRFAKYFLTVIIAGSVTYFATVNILSEVTILNFLISCVFVVSIPNIIFFVLHSRSVEFKNMFNRVKNLKGRFIK